MDVFVARQAILNRHKDVFGYELLFRSNEESNEFDGTQAAVATKSVIASTLFSAGLEGILGGKRAFINFDREMLLEGVFSILPKDVLVVEILETVEPDDEVVAACARLRQDGFTLAMDDFVHESRFERLVRTIHIVKVDVQATPRDEQKRMVAKFSKLGVRTVAEKVETLEEFEWAHTAGFDYFQGYFFMKPVVVRGTQIETSKMSCLRLLQEAQRDEIDFDELNRLIKRDVSFSYKLLRFTNSALFAHKSEIRTIERALMVLGEDGIRRWAAIAALPFLAKDKPQELIVQSLLRAQFAERLGRLSDLPVPPHCFLLGLFSLIDAILDRSIEYALQQIKLVHPVENALLGIAPPEDRLRMLYSLVREYERGDWDSVTEMGGRLGISTAMIGQAYVESVRWVDEAASLTR